MRPQSTTIATLVDALQDRGFCGYLEVHFANGTAAPMAVHLRQHVAVKDLMHSPGLECIVCPDNGSTRL